MEAAIGYQKLAPHPKIRPRFGLATINVDKPHWKATLYNTEAIFFD